MSTTDRILKLRDLALKHLKGQAERYALGGGTALSLVYFGHRESYDIDFFTQSFAERDIGQLTDRLASLTGHPIRPLSRLISQGKAQVLRFEMEGGLKIDFIEDFFKHYAVGASWNGIPVLSQESIYLRKIYAACGIAEVWSDTGRAVSVGGRQEAKDYFDLYYLSTVTAPLSSFVSKYCDTAETERVVAWFNRYDYMRMVDGLLELKTRQTLDAKEMKKHFASEVQKIIMKLS